MGRQGPRGVLMTASSRKKPTKGAVEKEVEEEDAEERRASRREWEELETSVGVANYDDVDGDGGGEDSDEEVDDEQSEPDVDGSNASTTMPGEEQLGHARPPPDRGERKRGGQNKTGSSKKRKREMADREEKAKAKAKADPDRWAKLRLEGDEKAKSIDLTRVVSYVDPDAEDSTRWGAASSSRPESTGNFRGSQLPVSNFFDAESDEDAS
mmetsp:Transcript_58145/g.138376  ORF Transcript_58145/g.138376 Transcript_58145/m.138376 type:complete len:211 (-) Transcript_58145:6-638(-)